jgi:hypothetical protein
MRKAREHPFSSPNAVLLDFEQGGITDAILEGARKARGEERLLSMGLLAESSLHTFEPVAAIAACRLR